jgi:tetratricopeptide (TPR) repeat protein
MNSSALNSYFYQGDYDKFIQSLPANDSVYILFYRGFGEYYKKDFSEAAKYFDRAYGLDPSLLQAQVGKALSDGIAHDDAKGLELLRQTEHMISERGVSDAEGIYKVAQAYAVLGDKASALRVLRNAIEGGFFSYPYFLSDPLLDPIRHESGFADLMNQARQRHEQFKNRFFPAR